VLTLRGHSTGIRRVLFSADGHRLASGGEDGGVRLWDAELLSPEARRERFRQQALAWHQREAAASWNGGVQWRPFAARFHLDPLVAARPTSGTLRLQRAVALADLGEFEAAAADADRAAALGPQNPMAIMVNAFMRLAVGDLAGYRRACNLMLLLTVRAPDQQAPIVAISSLGPEGVSQPDRLVAIARRAAQRAPQSYLNQLTLGMTLYRARNYEEAVRQFHTSIRVQGEEGYPWDWLFLAMAHHQLGHAAEARSWLDRATQWMDRAPPDAPLEMPEFDGPLWMPRLAFRVLRREAEALIKPVGPPAPNPSSRVP
jgi:tetratricopeptide (TPR) repeat protein